LISEEKQITGEMNQPMTGRNGGPTTRRGMNNGIISYDRGRILPFGMKIIKPDSNNV
jgi:hypothetical protein